jgi:hypothetical protein
MSITWVFLALGVVIANIALAVHGWYRDRLRFAVELIERADDVRELRVCQWCEEPGVTNDGWFRHRCSAGEVFGTRDHSKIRRFHAPNTGYWVPVLLFGVVLAPAMAIRALLNGCVSKRAREIVDAREIDRLIERSLSS